MEGVREVALSVVNGINSSILAYGQTSSGKTYTISGIAKYTIADIYDYIEKHKDREYLLKFSAMEIYNESVRDLLSTDSSPLRLLEDPGTFVENLTVATLRDWDHVRELLSVCEAQRQIGETSLNGTSSRSHQIIRLVLLFISLVFPCKIFSVASLGILTSIYLDQLIPQKIESSARDLSGNDNPSTLIAVVVMLDLTKCIVEFKSLPSQYISPDTPEMVTATAHIPIAVYWTIRSIVACASIIMNLIGVSHEYIASTTEACELSSLAHKVNNIHNHLNKQLSLCHQHIAMMKHDEAYRTLVRLFETPHIDNMKVLKALIYPKDDQLPLFESSTKRRVSIETLRRKIVLLLISELEFSREELSLFDSMYREAKQNPSRPESHHEVIWLPITDRSIPWNEENQQQFENSHNTMPWLSLHHASMLDPAAINPNHPLICEEHCNALDRVMSRMY
ncbi:hypothetical protein POM88_040151 [Heracleum sosnowskyi]|uniref:Kinesin motor domain-containing protein n=1 Tax=Heracleum sosnowskyi TaxID=360622 RepID=A0AAD8M739_9APIA|nr:hypothetical protein POM88_040151 [Heracleum sosnowskyi]